MSAALLAPAAALLLALAGCSSVVRVSTMNQPAVKAGWLFVNEDDQPVTRVFTHPGADGKLLLRLDVIRAGRAMTSFHTVDAEGQLGTPSAEETAAVQAAFDEAVKALEAKPQ